MVLNGSPGRGNPAVVPGRAALDHVAPKHDEVVQLVALGVLGLPAGEPFVPLTAIDGEPVGVDAVGFAEGAEGPDEGFDLVDVRAVDGTAGLHQSCDQRGFVAASGFADDEARVVERLGESFEVCLGISDGGLAVGPGVEDDDGVLADVAANKGSGRCHGVCPCWSFRLSAGIRDAKRPLQLIKRCKKSGQRTMMTAGVKPYRETVALAARRAGLQVRHGASRRSGMPTLCTTLNRQSRAAWRSDPGPKRRLVRPGRFAPRSSRSQ